MLQPLPRRFHPRPEASPLPFPGQPRKGGPPRWDAAGTDGSDRSLAFRAHAARFYRAAIADGSLAGLRKTIATKRIDEAKADGLPDEPEDAPAVAASGERPKPLSFDLGGVKLEMVGCPAGKFTMGYQSWKQSGFETEMCMPHEVTITRPFWAAKYPITLGMCLALRFAPDDVKRHMEWLQQHKSFKPEEAQMALERFNATQERVDDFLALLNKRINNRPKGYVFRLPTMAEWEYCLKADGSDEDLLKGTPKWEEYVLSEEVVAFMKGKGLYNDDVKKMWSSFKMVPVNLFRPNPWGICRLFDVDGEWIMDAVDDVNDVIYGKKGQISGPESHIFSGVKGVSLPDRDPVFIATSKNPVRLNRGYMFRPAGICVAYKWGITARVVLGPDLLKERGLAPPKPGR